MVKQIQSKEDVHKAFKALLAEHKALKNRIITVEETAQNEKEKALVTTVAEYTPDSIVKGAAAMQLEFATSMEQLTEQLQQELTKLEELKVALKVESDNLKDANNTKVALDALHILKKEQAQRKAAFEEEISAKLEALSEEMEKTKASWEKEAKTFETNVTERIANLEKQRSKELENYKYELDRTYKIEQDEYDNQKKLLLRRLEETQAQKEKDWSKREKALLALQEDFDKYKKKVDNFEQELEEETKKAKDKAIKEANRKAKVTRELYEKEVEGKQKIAELQIASLEQTVENQKARILQINAELKEALAQVQALSIKALENSSRS